MFKQRKHKTFNYRQRYRVSESDETSDDFAEKWNDLKASTKRRGTMFTSLPALIIMLVALFVLMYVLEGYIK